LPIRQSQRHLPASRSRPRENRRRAPPSQATDPKSTAHLEVEEGSPFPTEAASLVPVEALSARWGVTIHPITRENSGPPMQGGLEVVTPGDQIGTIVPCSTAMNAYRDVQISPLIPERVRHYFVISAGHCGDVGEPITHWGGWTSTVDDLRYGDRVDSLLAEHINPIDRSNQIYLTETTSRTINAWQRSNQDAVNDLICLSGIRSNNACGLLTATSVSFTHNGVAFRDFRRSDSQLQCEKGDSGAGVYRPFGSNATIVGVAAFKVVNSLNGAHLGCMYGHVDYLRQALTVVPLTSAS